MFNSNRLRQKFKDQETRRSISEIRDFKLDEVNISIRLILKFYNLRDFILISPENVTLRVLLHVLLYVYFKAKLCTFMQNGKCNVVQNRSLMTLHGGHFQDRLKPFQMFLQNIKIIFLMLQTQWKSSIYTCSCTINLC